MLWLKDYLWKAKLVLKTTIYNPYFYVIAQYFQL